MEGNVLEVLQAMQVQQLALQSQIALKEALDDSGLSLESRRAIRAQFQGKPLDLGALDDAIAAARSKEADALKTKEAATATATADEPADVSAHPPTHGIEIRKTKTGRHFLFVEGEMIGNFGTHAEAEAAKARYEKNKGAQIEALKESLEEQYAVRTKLAECKVLLMERLADSKLPLTAQEKIQKDFSGKVFTELQLDEAINDMWDVVGKYVGTGQVIMPDQERGIRSAHVLESDFERKCIAFDGFWAGQNLPGADGKAVPRFRSLQEAYVAFMHRPYDPINVIQEMGRMEEGRRYDSHNRVKLEADGRLSEAITTTSWAQIMGDSVARRVIAEYRVPDLQLWRQIVSEISTINDFRLQRRMRFGGYGTLPVVNEGISYTPLPTPTDQEAQYRLQKRGGLESITMEAVANDDVQVIRRIPQKLGRAAAQTLFRGIFDMIANNLNLAFDDDTTALFTAGHANMRTGVTLDADGLDLAVQDMAVQTSYNNSVELLGLRPRFLLHPSSLWRPATKLTQTERGEPFTADNDINPYRRFGMVPMEIPYWTNQAMWVLIADPRDIPTIEVGFFRGQEDPEIFISDQENQSGGAMFEADKITYKIRFIFGYGILDSRAFWANLS